MSFVKSISIAVAAAALGLAGCATPDDPYHTTYPGGTTHPSYPTYPGAYPTYPNPDIARYVSIADTPFRVLGLTVVCLTCGGTPQMANHPTDGNWFMECGCTKRVLRNPSQVTARKAS